MASDLEAALWFQFRAAGLAARCTRELRFAPPRRFRLDFAFPHIMLGIEVEGGTWIGGRHNRGAGFEKDCEKQNLAVEKGWAILRYTKAQIDSGEALKQIVRVATWREQ